MAKSIKLKDNNYIDSSGIMNERNLLSNILNNKGGLFKRYTLFSYGTDPANKVNAPSAAGQYADLNDSIDNYDLIGITIGTRIYQWTRVVILIPKDQIGIGTGSGNWLAIPYASYSENVFNNIQVAFPTTTRLQVMYNSRTIQSNDNGGWIYQVIGYKIGTRK